MPKKEVLSSFRYLEIKIWAGLVSQKSQMWTILLPVSYSKYSVVFSNPSHKIAGEKACMIKSRKVLSFTGNIYHPRSQKTTRRQCKWNAIRGLDNIFDFSKLKMLKALLWRDIMKEPWICFNLHIQYAITDPSQLKQTQASSFKVTCPVKAQSLHKLFYNLKKSDTVRR